MRNARASPTQYGTLIRPMAQDIRPQRTTQPSIDGMRPNRRAVRVGQPVPRTDTAQPGLQPTQQLPMASTISIRLTLPIVRKPRLRRPKLPPLPYKKIGIIIAGLVVLTAAGIYGYHVISVREQRYRIAHRKPIISYEQYNTIRSVWFR
jgi:hypothetical protein